MGRHDNFFVAVTGAQGVGKSTFCRQLRSRFAQGADVGVTLLDGLGDKVRAMGIPLGSASEPSTIAAIFAAHLERESSAPAGLIVLDRCVVDALAYTRKLAVSSEVERRLFESVTSLASGQLGLVLSLTLSPFFADKGAPHETPALREGVAREIGVIIAQLKLPRVELDAASPDAVETGVAAINEALRER